MKVVIIGGVAAGMSAAARLRRLDEQAEITVLEQGPDVSVASCGLPYYVGGEIADRSALLVQTPASLKARFNLDVRVNHTVTHLDVQAKKVFGMSRNQAFSVDYDKLILALGSKAMLPPLTGIAAAKNIFTLHTLANADKLLTALKQPLHEAVVIGAGSIGLEAAEALSMRGLHVTLLEQAGQVLPSMDLEMAKLVEQTLKTHNVSVLTNQSAAAFEDAGKTIVLENGKHLATDLTLMATGAHPNTALAQAAGIKTGFRGGIIVDDHYQTSQPDVYAVGDACLTVQKVTGQPALIPLAGPANRQGRQAADAVFGLSCRNRGSLGTAIVRCFDTAAASVGLSQKAAEKAGLDPAVVHVLSGDHADFYPNAKDLMLKLIFNRKDGTLYGAEAVGSSADKRIDVLSAAIQGHLTVQDLPELDLSYAPPFGSAKDPVNLLGYAAENQISGLSKTIDWSDLPKVLAKGATLIDVRGADEFAQAHLKGALNLPLDGMRESLQELDPHGEYITYCHSGKRSYIAERLLRQHGFNVRNLDGAFPIAALMYPETVVNA